MAIAPLLSNFARNVRPRTQVPRSAGVPKQQRVTHPASRGFRGFIKTPTITARAPAVPSVAAPAGAPAAAAVPVAPALTPLPPDATYEQQMAAAASARDQTISGLGQQRTAGLQEFGYTEGAPGQVAFDPNNPVSRAALLRRKYVEAQRGNVTGMAARGQLYSGALQNQQDYATRGFNEGENSLQRALIAFLSQNTGNVSRAGTDYQTAVSGYAADRVSRAMQNPLYNPELLAAAPDVPDAPAAGGPGAPPVVHVAAAPRSTKTKTVNGKRYRLGASGKWIPM